LPDSDFEGGIVEVLEIFLAKFKGMLRRVYGIFFECILLLLVRQVYRVALLIY